MCHVIFRTTVTTRVEHLETGSPSHRISGSVGQLAWWVVCHQYTLSRRRWKSYRHRRWYRPTTTSDLYKKRSVCRVCSHELWTSTFWCRMPAASRTVPQTAPATVPVLHQMERRRRRPAVITAVRQLANCTLRLQTTTTQRQHGPPTTVHCRRWPYTSSPWERCLSLYLSSLSSTPISTSGQWCKTFFLDIFK